MNCGLVSTAGKLRYSCKAPTDWAIWLDWLAAGSRRRCRRRNVVRPGGREGARNGDRAVGKVPLPTVALPLLASSRTLFSDDGDAAGRDRKVDPWPRSTGWGRCPSLLSS